MKPISRRSFIEMALALGATAAWGSPFAKPSKIAWRERRDIYPEGVASGDPESDSVLLWTRRPPVGTDVAEKLNVEIAEDGFFERVVATVEAPISEASDWTCRVLVGGLKPARVYWYRFTDAQGHGSRVGPHDHRAGRRRRRAGALRLRQLPERQPGRAERLPADDLRGRTRAPEQDRLGFVLHLGDFIYEIVWYPEDRPQGMYDRRIRDIVRYQHGEKIGDFHIPTTVDDYRAVYRAYLHDPDLQDARARWPFVCMWDNHEFSWLGWQGLQEFDGRDAARRRRARWPRIRPGSSTSRRGSSSRAARRWTASIAPQVVDAPIETFDEHGLGQEPNNLAAINSLTGYRALRWGRHVDLIITDQRSYRSEDPPASTRSDTLFERRLP